MQTPSNSNFQKIGGKITSNVSKGIYKITVGRVLSDKIKDVKLFFSIQRPSFFGQYNKYFVYMNIGLFISCLFSGVSLVYIGTIKYMMDKSEK